MHLIFVYGTLKRGFSNAHLLKNAEFICEATSRDALYNMVCFQSAKAKDYTYPAVFDGGAYKVQGELYRVTDAELKALDDLEDESERYKRTPITLDSGHTAEFYMSMEYDRPTLDRHVELDVETNIQSYRV